MKDGAASVWPTGQLGPLAQLREAGCVPGTEFDSERIPPAVAAHAIARYTRPGDLVLDPDCGAGIVLTQALRADRHAIGLTTQEQWWKLARANVNAAKVAGARRDGSVLDARPRALATVRAVGLVGRVGLVLIGLRVGSDSGPLESAVTELVMMLRCCEPLLRTGGHIAVVARPRRRRDGSQIDLTTLLAEAGRSAGLALVDRCIALSAQLRAGQVVSRKALSDRHAVAHAGSVRVPAALTVHHEVLVFLPAVDAEFAAASAMDAAAIAEDGRRIQAMQPPPSDGRGQAVRHAC